MKIEAITRLDDDLLEGMARLMPQLKGTPAAPDEAHLRALLASPGSILLAARREDGYILGMATLILYRTANGVHARLEDLVVDASARGQGLGAALTRAVLKRARLAGAKYLALTSNPRREAANALYRKLGFTRRETNLYSYTLETSAKHAIDKPT